MSYPINYPTPQGANVQIFTSYRVSGDNINTGFDWVKPQGASFVWFTLIGPGGNGSTTTGGGSGAVTNFMCPAFLIPDVLSVYPGQPSNAAASIKYRQKDGTGYTLLTANAGSTSAASAMTANNFTAMGFFQSVQGQDGSPGSISASTSAFLSGGGAFGSSQTSNYGYSTGGVNTNRNGIFLTSPVIVGAGGMGTGRGGIGCGAGVDNTSGGGSGLVVIITW